MSCRRSLPALGKSDCYPRERTTKDPRAITCWASWNDKDEGLGKRGSLVAGDCHSQENARYSVAVPIHSWEWPGQPWTRIHIDHVGPFLGKMFLTVVDACSKVAQAIEDLYSISIQRQLLSHISH